ncbi:hypothetical protein TNCV_2039512 [Trichonephila clavipes]|nr:hypothetical protein TNCV_2039512 [Trichonephila clavipes]
MAGRYTCKLTVSEALEYMPQVWKNEYENDNDEEIVISDGEYVPRMKKIFPYPVPNFPVQRTSKKNYFWEEKVMCK